MKINIFNRWLPTDNYLGHELSYKTKKLSGQNCLYKTYIKDIRSGAIIVSAIGTSKAGSKQNATRLLQQTNTARLKQAIRDNTVITRYPPPVALPGPLPDIEWRDGIGHSARTQNAAIGESTQSVKDNKAKLRNFVAKHSRTINKPGPMKDKKNDYRRKPKHPLLRNE